MNRLRINLLIGKLKCHALTSTSNANYFSNFEIDLSEQNMDLILNVRFKDRRGIELETYKYNYYPNRKLLEVLSLPRATANRIHTIIIDYYSKEDNRELTLNNLLNEGN